jgi:hypothetical protein
MKNFITLLSVIALTASSALAAAPTADMAGHSYSESHPEFSADVGLGDINSKFAFGIGLKGQVPIVIDGNDFKFGLRSGFYFGPSSPTSWAIPILATSEYDFKGDNVFKPYLGLEIGADVDHASYEGTSSTGANFAFLFVPGVNFGDGYHYFIELPIGTMADGFCVLPSLGMHF